MALQLVEAIRDERSKKEFSKAKTFQKAKDDLEDSPTGIPIESLVVATKATTTLAALRQCQKRLTRNSTIVLLQNGMGIYESIVENLFPHPDDRPNIILATTTHGAWKKREVLDAHHVVHAGKGDLQFAIVPDSSANPRDFERTFWDASPALHPDERLLSLDDIEDEVMNNTTPGDPKYLSLRKTVDALLSLDLNTKWRPMAQLQIRLRQKVTINSSVNPITALVGCRNGHLLGTTHSRNLIRSVCREASDIFREAAGQPEDDQSGEWLFGGGNASTGGMQVLSAGFLENETYRVIKNTASNYSSMLLDMEKGAVLEVDYMNGYLSRLGQHYNVPTRTIDALRDAVLVKASLNRIANLV
ncbi:2-dehydropantoate 2-reductase (Ketopantoate reductase) (KPA reductase) (KPR) [Serendipita sp. 401]|nr:2-dehydropantoate 2-reductase (Ketopantoate reductase) (KPA reductase) (KPR) [Serendipita sp. 401]